MSKSVSALLVLVFRSSLRSRSCFLVLSMILFAVSLTQNGFSVEHSGADAWPGWGLVVFGPLGLFSGEPANLVWMANPLLLLAWLTFIEPTGIFTFCFGLVALIVAGSFLFFSKIAVAESGLSSVIASHGLGYWLWLGSICCSVASGMKSMFAMTCLIERER